MNSDISATRAADEIATLSLTCIEDLKPTIIEKLFQTKQERTFSSLLAYTLTKQFENDDLTALIEIKGKNFKRSESDTRETENSHDIALLDTNAEPLTLIECKVWYHFDGIKGKGNGVNPNIISALIEDIKKLKVTMQSKKPGIQGFLVLFFITPNDIENIPSSYRPSHMSALKKSSGNETKLRFEAISQVLGVIFEQFQDLKSIKHLSSENHLALDVIVAEV
jgi:hypothetical protein